MNLLEARNVHEMLPIALNLVLKRGIECESRNGPVIRMEGPVLLCYNRPTERVLFWPQRDANPFFHLVEAVWMLAGRRDVNTLVKYAKQIGEYSDDGQIFNAPYGYRWRHHFQVDQIALIAERLRENPNCRRQVLSNWDPYQDLPNQASKDLPCNTQAYFQRGFNGELDITVVNRSNDLVWGCCGANAVHFSFLQEYVAYKIGCPVGKYYQFTNNLHVYKEVLTPGLISIADGFQASPYELDEVEPFPMDVELHEAEDIFNEYGVTGKFLQRVVAPVMSVHRLYKEKKYELALASCASIVASDWRRACVEWLERRAERRNVL